MKKYMRHFAVIIICIFIAVNCFAQTETRPAENKSEKPKTPADEIVKFWFVMIKTGQKNDLDSATRSKLFEGHMANIIKLYNDGVLKVSGPFGKNDFSWRGIFIFDCKTKEEVQGYLANDPAITAGLLAVDIVPWYGAPIGSFKKGKPEKKED